MSIPATGWNHDFRSVEATLNLPPGWWLFHAGGADEVPSTWIEEWTLLSIFLVVIFAVSIAQLLGWRWGLVALVALVLCFPEEGSPRWVFAFVLAGLGLARALPDGWGRLSRVVAIYTMTTLLVLLLFAVPFMVEQVRQGMYPILELPWRTIDEGVRAPPAAADAKYDIAQANVMEEESGGARDLNGLAVQSKEVPNQQVVMRKQKKGLSYKSYLEVDPNAVVQTGPGLPGWSWKAVSIQWSGPVSRGETLDLWLVPPWTNFLLGIVRTLSLALLFVGLLVASRRLGGGRSVRGAGAVPAVLAVIAAVVFPVAAGAEYPSAELLGELRARLLEAPECLPECASVSRVDLSVRGGSLYAKMEVHAGAEGALPLPGSAGHWIPERVLVDGVPASGLSRTSEGSFLAALSPGRHAIELEGPLPARASVQIALPLKPARVTVTAPGFRVDGLHPDGRADDSLQLTWIDSVDRGTKEEEEALPSFVKVERALQLGLNWEMETIVERVTALGSGVVIEIPLLEGESITTEGFRVVERKVLVSLGPRVSEVRFRSILAQREAIELASPEHSRWTEEWRVEASPVWHVEPSGVPAVHAGASSSDRVWRPWPGERLTLRVTRPNAVSGQTFTVDQSGFEVRPGPRATEAKLSLRIRSSRGGQHAMGLPEGAELQSVMIDGTAQPIRQEGRRLTIPLKPGLQNIEVSWREENGISSVFRTPEVDLSAPSVNSAVSLHMPHDRWTLFVVGPSAGPAILFWSLLAVLWLAALGLSRLRFTPLRFHHWALLAVGLTQASIAIAIIVAGWLLFLGWRRDHDASPVWFNLRQLLIAVWTVTALACLAAAIYQGLLGTPDMQISGNGSSREVLKWFVDRTESLLPRGTTFSVPVAFYRFAMLAWALWLAVALLRWIKWGWSCFVSGGLWKRSPPKARPAPAGPAAPPALP